MHASGIVSEGGENIITEHKSLSRVYEAAYQTYLQNLTMSVWTEKMSSILMSENCHSPRKTYSNNKVGLLSSLLRNRIYLMCRKIKEKVYDNIRTIFIYSKIAKNKNRY